jgi:ribosomal protein L32E
MIEKQDVKELINSFNQIKESAENFKEIIDIVATEEDKKTEEYRKLIEESNSIEEELEKSVTDEDKEEIKKLSEIQTYINHLKSIVEDEKTDEIIRKRAEKQIFMIRSSYTFEVFNTKKPSLSIKKIKEDYMQLKKEAERKMEKNKHFRFFSAWHIDKHIRAVLPDELKSKAKLVAGYIYAFINTCSLKPDGYSMFVFFLIKNINNLDKDFPEREVLIENLTKLAKSL